jgi:hypothetical protein
MADFTFFSDPGHGWLAVSAADLREVGLFAVDFSRYSFMSGDRFYLEEDCDAPKFMDAWERVHGRKIELREDHSPRNGFIRSLPRIQP